MEKFTLYSSNHRSVKFEGELLGRAKNSPSCSNPYFSGSTGEWVELALYKTKGGQYVCERAYRTQWIGRHDIRQYRVVKTLSEVFGFFGFEELAQSLYQDCQIDYSIEIE